MSKRAQNASQPKIQAFNAVDERLRQLSRDILSSTPYQLKVDKEIKLLDPRQAIEWRRGCPFEPHEERLQYLTFRSNFDKDTIFRAVGDWDDGNGNIMSKTDKTSGLSTPLPGQAPKKKITLSDYKNKAAGQVTTSISAPSKPNGEVKPSETGSGVRVSSQSEPKPLTVDARRGVKRPVDNDTDSKDSKRDASPPHPPPFKKARLPSKPASAAQPETVEKPAVWSLPPMLSPTLPVDIEEELAKLPAAGGSKRDRGSDAGAKATSDKKYSSTALSSKESSRNVKGVSKELAQNTNRPGKTSPSLKATKSNHERQPKSASTQRTPDVSAKGVAVSKSSAHGANNGDKKGVSVNTPGTALQKPEKSSLIAKLKIPKSIRRNCMRILQMQPRPSKKFEQDVPKRDEIKVPAGKSRDRILPNGAGQDSEPQLPRSEHPQERSTSTDRSGRKIKPPEANSNLPQSGEKRKKPHDQRINLEPTIKRQKQPAGLDISHKPHTPIKPPLRSPLVSQNSSAQKPRLSTPKRDLKSTAMQRIGSSEGDVQTPLGAVRGTTPTATGTSERVTRDGPSSSNNSSGTLVSVGNEDVTAWKAEQRKFEALGRTLKHDAKAALPEDGDFKHDSPSMKQGAAIAFEAVLAFLLAFTIADEINRINRVPTDATGWRSLLPFLQYVQRVTRVYRPLLGLTYQLEAVCRDTISLCNADRLAPDEQRPSISDSSAINGTLSAIEKAHGENLRQSYHVWQLGYSELSVREMQRSFPGTWAKGADSPGPGKGKENLTPNNYGAGSYYLPLGPTTSGIEGVRAGWQMLKEWTEKNEVEWQGKMGL